MHSVKQTGSDHEKKQDTRWRKSISSRERLAVCLRHMATGDALNTISFKL